MILAIIQARLSSSRFPRKVLADIHGKPMIRHVYERVCQVRGLDAVKVAVPFEEVTDDAWPVEVTSFDCATNDVLSRFHAVALEAGADVVMRVTGDCPLWEPRIAERVLELFQSRDEHYAWNVAPGYIDGTDVEVFSVGALMWADHEATDPHDREHVTPWIRRTYPVATLLPDYHSDLKTSVDTLEDLERVRALCKTV